MRMNMPCLPISRGVYHSLTRLWLILSVPAAGVAGTAEASHVLRDSTLIQFIFTSDAHYGIARESFRGMKSADARIVNAALIAGMNAVSASTFPADNGVKAGALVGPIEYIIQAGDVANRQEMTWSGTAQDASTSWRQFLHDFDSSVTLKNRQNRKTELLVVPGNHDVSNAIGFHRTLYPRKDPSAVVGMYNLMLKPSTPVANSSFDYRKHKVHYSRDIAGAHFMFVNVWPDSAERLWMTKELSAVSSATPVLLFAHDPPMAPPKHFTNPALGHPVIAEFENVIEESWKDTVGTPDSSIIEHRGLAAFLESYPNVKGYFHGHSHANKFYSWEGPDSTLRLSVFQADAPFWNGEADTAETGTSFQVVSIDLSTWKMTVRECLWNAVPQDSGTMLRWGISKTVSLR